ncbi:hypothetical protein [Actinopolyspora halophila]|uniref:hypothetical protein n=1 Tax=Actinopolyspora halophila TaxID=1850 RepID=UPI001B7FE3A4|nr:hypothetical protein [Actinopolyspora halophila]
MTGSQQNFERGDTAPLNAVRGGSGGPPDRGTQGRSPEGGAGGTGEERTRPTFPPHQAAAAPSNGGHGSRPPAGQPAADQGAAGVPPNAAGAAQSRPGPNGAGESRAGAGITPTGWVVRGLVLVLVSVLSGVLWLMVKPSDTRSASEGPATGQEGPNTEYDFEKYIADEPPNCADHSTMKIADYFERTSCSHVTRALYTTRLSNGERVLTSVVTVLMPDVSSATELERLTTQNATGNIEDLVTAGSQVPEGYPELTHDYGYASTQQERLVVIGESSYFHRSGRDDGRLKHVTSDALQLGAQQDREPG